MNVRWILFDAVGTLIYPDPPVGEVYCAAGRRLGSRLQTKEIEARFRQALAAEQSGGSTSEANERERWRRIVGRVMNDVASQADALFAELWRHFSQPEHWRVYADVAGTLPALRDQGLRLGIASNFDARLKPIVAGHPQLAACEAVFVSSEVGYTKPDARFFKAIESRLAMSSAQLALVGDDEVSDAQGATAAGWHTVRLAREGMGSVDAIRSLDELLR